MTTLIGTNFAGSWTAAQLRTSGISFKPGCRSGIQPDGKEYVFVKATAAIAQYDVSTYDETFQTTVAPLSTSNDAFGDKIGVAPVAIASGSYGWLQIYGPCTLNAIASTAANAILGSSATAGHVDDVVSTGFATLDGIVLTTARGGTNGSAPGNLNYPVQRSIA